VRFICLDESCYQMNVVSRCHSCLALLGLTDIAQPGTPVVNRACSVPEIHVARLGQPQIQPSATDCDEVAAQGRHIQQQCSNATARRRRGQRNHGT
jgi:hypothetical protein